MENYSVLEKLVEGRLFVIIYLLLGAKAITFHFIKRLGCNFLQKCQIKKSFFLSYILFFHDITAPKTLKGSRNIQGLALIRALLSFNLP